MSKLTKELNKLKTKAFKEGTKANNIQDFFYFWQNNKISNINKDGYIAEIIIFYLLGIVKQECTDYGISCRVYCNERLDELEKTDLELNGRRFQLKYDWKIETLEHMIASLLKDYNVQLVCLPKEDTYGPTSGISIIQDLLTRAGQDKDAVEEFSNNAECLDLVEEIWDWFIRC